MEQIQDFEVGPDELWQAVSDPDRMEWLGDEVELDLRPGGQGRVVDDGQPRRLVVDRVDDGRSLSFHWWPEGDEHLVSRVDLIVVARPDGSRLVVRETLASAVGVAVTRAASGSLAPAVPIAVPALAPLPAGAAGRWSVRLALLALSAGVLAPLSRI